MTEVEAMDVFDRLKRAGYRLPSGVDESEMFAEWVRALQSYATGDVDAGVTLLIRQQSSTFWPAIGELRTAIASATAGREKATCATCHGSTWVEAPPYRANGGLLYPNAVDRCPDCGVPAPTFTGTSRQTPVTPAEVRAWADRRGATEPMTREMFLERCREIVGRMSMAAVGQPVALPAAQEEA